MKKTFLTMKLKDGKAGWLLGLAMAASSFGLFAQPGIAPNSASVASAMPSPSATPKAAPSPASQPLKIGSVTVSGSLRVRAESWDWFDTSAGDGNYTFGAGTLRLALSWHNENVEWMVEGEAPFVLGLPTNAIAAAPQGQLGLGASHYAANGKQDGSLFLKQAFVNFKGLGNNNQLKIGRFEFNDGLEVMPKNTTLATVKREHIGQRLIGSVAWSHVGRSFDGVQYGYNNKGWNVTFFGARPTEGVFQLRGMNEMDVDVAYGAVTKAWQTKNSDNDARAFVIHYHDGRDVLKVDNRSAALRTADLPNNIRVTSVGGHYIGARKAGAGTMDVLLWGGGQFGAWGNQTQRSGALAVEGGYQFGGKLQPWIRLGYNYSTGDDNPNDAMHGTYFQLLPTPRIYARTPFFNAMNNTDTFVEFRLKPHAKLGLRSDLHRLSLSSARDLWYGGGGAFQAKTFGMAGRPSNSETNLGWFPDLSADYLFRPRTTFSFYVGGSAGGRVPAASYPAGNSLRFAYFELTQKF